MAIDSITLTPGSQSIQDDIIAKLAVRYPDANVTTMDDIKTILIQKLHGDCRAVEEQLNGSVGLENYTDPDIT